MWTTIIITVLVGFVIYQYMRNRRLSANAREEYTEIQTGGEHDQPTHGSGMKAHRKSSHKGHGCC